MSAADMFASKGCEHACSDFQEKPTKHKNTTASLLGGALAAGSVILATQLRADAQETLEENTELEVSNLSPEVIEAFGLPAPASFNVDGILGSVITNEVEHTEVASLANTQLPNPQSPLSENTTFPTENGFPNGAITVSPGVDDPSQTTDGISTDAPGNRDQATSTPNASVGDGIFVGEQGDAGTNGIDGTNGQNGRDGEDGLSVFVIDPATLQNPEVIAGIASLGLNVIPGPAGFGYITVSAVQLAELQPLLNSIAFQQIATIDGTPENDILQGNARDNTINGLDGNDTLIGGTGADALNGGSGNDTADYYTSETGIEINLATALAQGGDAEGDQLSSIESIIGSNAVDTIFGDEQNNALFGNDGNDTLFGDAGNDRLQGGVGADTIDGGEGVDLADYSTSSAGVNISLLFDTANEGDAEGDELDNIENLNGSRFFDTLEGDNNSNRLGGLSGDDELFGEGGNDTLLGGSGADLLDGGEGIDTSDYTASGEGVLVNLATGEARFGQAEGDAFFSIENLAGSAFDDELTGDAGANRLTGRAGDDVLIGNGGNDTLIGSDGNDILNGGEGDDVFTFGNDTGFDIIQDFEAGEGRMDRVDLRPLDDALFGDVDDVQAALTDTHDGAVLAFEDSSVLFQNVLVSEFAADDFILA